MTGSGPGVFVPVVGPSGVGKDTLIEAARRDLAGEPRFAFVRRVVTRTEGGNEDHDTLGEQAFEATCRRGGFALHWGAHGLRYGIPAGALDDVHAGRVVVANLSRAMLDEARRIFPRVAVLSVVAAPDVLAARLAARGRESVEEIQRRLHRGDASRPAGNDVIEVDNGGPLPVAVGAMLAALRLLAERPGSAIDQ